MIQAQHTCGPIWRCQQCGVTERRDATGMKRRYCSMACKGAAQRAAGNPAFKHGRRIDSIAGQRRRKPNVAMTCAKAKAISDWVMARQALGSAADLAKRLNVPLYAVYRYAPVNMREERA